MSDTNQNENQNQAVNLLSVESLINSYTVKLDELQKDSREQKEMLQSFLDNDQEYLDAAKEADKLAKVKTLAKQKVLKRSEAQVLVDKLKEISSELREVKTAMSDYLTQYVNLSGSRQIERPDGVLMDIVHSAKLVKKKS